MLDSSINLGIMKEDKYVQKLLDEIWEHQKGAPIRPDTPSELRSSTRKVISLLNDDNESETTPLKQGPVSEEKKIMRKVRQKEMMIQTVLLNPHQPYQEDMLLRKSNLAPTTTKR